MIQNDPTSFFDALMTHIMEGMYIPKVQIERVIGPVFGMFCERAISHVMDGDDIVTLCPEFPLRKETAAKPGTNQSTNVDWLLYNRTKAELIFLELKTADTSFDEQQANIYAALSNKIKEGNASFLLEDVEKIKGASTEYGKYAYLIQRIADTLPGHMTAFAGCQSVRVVYLVPEVTVKAESERYPYFDWFSFKDLPEDLGPEFLYNAQWRSLRNKLLELDYFSRSFRNAQAKQDRKDDRSNYREHLDFAAVMELCEREGNAVVIGYTGGPKALAATSSADLQNRQYKWDYAEGGQGRKIARNWISGSMFRELVLAEASPDVS
jgi:hypothetical protein